MRTCASKAILLAAGFSLAASFAVSVQAHTLREAVQETVNTNPDVQITTKVERASHEQVKQARAGYFPVLDVNAAFGRERSNNILNLDGTPNESNEWTNLWRKEVGVELRENLFHGFETWYEVKRTQAKTDANGYLVCATAQDQALLAVQAYISVLRDREIVSIARRNLDSHRSFYSMIKDRGESGVGREADIHQVNGRLALAKSNLFAVENNLANSEALYFRVTGLEPKNLVAPPIPSGRFVPKTLEEATTLALRYHPKMRIAVVDVEEARAQHNVSFRSAFPVIDVVAKAENDRNVNGIEGPDNSYSLMGELHYNLFRGGADVARQRETAYLTQEAAEVRNRTCRQIVQNIRLSWNAMETSESRLPLLREHSRAAQESLNAYTEQFKLSKRSLLDVLDTENERFTADSDYCRGRYDALYSLYRVVDGMGQVANFLQVTLPNEAREIYGTYQDLAGPVVNNRQYDAGLELVDYPSRFYHSHEPVNANRPYVANYDSGITREFANEQISKVFTQTNNPKIHSFKAADKHAKVKEAKDSAASTVKANKKIASKSQAKVSQQSEEGFHQSKAQAKNINAKPLAQAASSTVATHESNHHANPAITAQTEAARELALQSTADALAHQQNNQADSHNAKSTERFSGNRRQQDRFATKEDSNQPKLTADDFANDTHTVASNESANQTQNTSSDSADVGTAAQQAVDSNANQQQQAQQSPSDHSNGQQQAQKSQPGDTNGQLQAQKSQPRDANEPQQAQKSQPSNINEQQQIQQASSSSENANEQQPATQAKESAKESSVQQQSNLNNRRNRSQEANSDAQQNAAKLSATTQAIQKSWAVKVGSYTSDEAVKKSVAKLQQNGFNGFIKEIKTADGTTTEVFAGPTAKRSAALDMYNQLKKAKISGNVVSTEYNEQKS
jgi:adhesin transport system outer membrane protein